LITEKEDIFDLSLNSFIQLQTTWKQAHSEGRSRVFTTSETRFRINGWRCANWI